MYKQRPRRDRRLRRTPRRAQPQQVPSAAMVQPTAVRAFPSSWDPMVVDPTPMRMPKRMPISTFRRTYTAAVLTANTGDTLNSFIITLGGLPNATDFTALYDQYRIMEAIFTFTPYATVAASTAVGAGFPGIIGTWIDVNDASLPANLQEGQQFDSYQRNTATEPFSRTVIPRNAVATYSGTFTSYQSASQQWIDSGSPNVQFYGLKSCIRGSTYATVTNVYEVEVTVTLQCRSQK